MAKSQMHIKSSRNKRKFIYFLLFTLIFDLFFLYLLKYSNKNLSTSEFNPYCLGNILNFVLTALPAGSLVYLFINPERMEHKKFYMLTVIAVLMTGFLFFAFLGNKLWMPIPVMYISGYPFHNVYIGFLYISYQFFQFFLIWLILFNIFSHYKFVYLKSLIYSILSILSLVLFSFIYTMDYEDFSEYYIQDGNKADAAVVMGAAVWSKNRPSPLFGARIGKASNLYNSGIVKKILVTGGSAPGEKSEAEVAKTFLIRYGVDKKDILQEKNTSSTSEQVEFIKEDLIKKRKLERIIIVSDEFHLKRISEICDFYNVNAHGIASKYNMSIEKALFFRLRESLALLVFWLFAL